MPTYKPEGNPETAILVFVGEAPAADEIRLGKPFAGTAGHIHDECLEHAGIIRSQTYTTNVFDYRVVKHVQNKNNFFHPETNELIYSTRSGFTDLGLVSVRRLAEELEVTKANVIVPLGGPAVLAICGKHSITKWRGSILYATMDTIVGRKCIPSIHPINASYGMYTNRYLIKADYERALRESAFPEIIRPDYKFILYPTFSDCMQFLTTANDVPVTPVAVDIEVMFGQVERISFAWSDLECISIPFLGWTAQQEADLWLATAKYLENPNVTKIFQNGVFDCQVLAMLHGVVVAPPIHDTMIAHHIMYPDFRKNLALFGSLYTDQPFWKDMVSHGEIDNPEG